MYFFFFFTKLTKQTESEEHGRVFYLFTSSINLLLVVQPCFKRWFVGSVSVRAHCQSPTHEQQVRVKI